ncbi:snaclec 1-like [Rhinoraja longicauda]
MMLMCVLVLTALLASDVAGTTDSLGPEETQQDLEMRALSEGPCAENWFYFPKLRSCYQFFSHNKNWSDAEAFCKQQAHYGHLATVTSSEHDTFITNVIAAVIKGNPFAWIGLNDRCEIMELGMTCRVMKHLVLFVPTKRAVIRRLQNGPLNLPAVDPVL